MTRELMVDLFGISAFFIVAIGFFGAFA